MPQRELELGLQERERRTELVARIGGETPLALEADVEALEHLVERLSKAKHLVVRSRQRESPRRGRGRDLARAASHRLHRPQRRSCDEVADAGRDEQRERKRDQELREQSVESVVAILERLPDDHHATASIGDRQRDETGRLDVTVPAFDRALDAQASVPSPSQLVVGEQLRPSRVSERGANRPVGVDHLCEALLVADETQVVEPRLTVARCDRCEQRVAANAESLVHALVERRAEPDIEERPERREDDRHDDGEREREPNPDRQPAHAASPSFRSRYPAPRTVSIDSRPNGRSIFSRRYPM